MKLVVDANILFATLIKESSTAELFLSDKLNLYAPEFLFDEFAKYEQYIIEKTKRSKQDFIQYLNLLKDEIEIVPLKLIMPFIDKAEKFSPDPKDSVYLACALAINSKIWSNDKKLKDEQNNIEVLTTEDLIFKVGILKKEK